MSEHARLERAGHAVLATTTAIARELHAGRTTPTAFDLDSDLDRDVGLDSLSRVELGARLEREFAVRLDERAVFEAATPRDLLRQVMKAHAGRPLTARIADPAPPTMPGAGLPARATTLPEVLAWHVEHAPRRPHIQFYDDYTDGAVLSHAALQDAASAVAAALQAHGLEPGERVALMLPTSRAYFVCFFGVVLAGGVPVPIYPPVRRQQLEDHLRRQGRILHNCACAMLVTTAEAVTLARLLTAQVESLRHVFEASTLERHGGRPEAVARSAEDLAFLQYTSGSTGDPKGVMLSHANLLANVRADGLGMGVTDADVFVSWLPLYHDMGLIGAWLGSLYHGVRLVVMPPLSFLARPERWLWAIHRYGGTLSAAPNFAFELCVQRIREAELEGLDLSRWRIAANGAEPISAATLEAFCTRFAVHGFRREAMFPVYGLAECAVGLAFTPLGRGPRIDHVERDALARDGHAVPATAATPAAATLAVVACGQPLPAHEIRIVDDAGREVPERVEGHLQFRGPSATRGYFGRAEETARLIRDGWLDSGDRAYVAAGDVYLTGRVKDIIIRAGRNIYPAELEDAVGMLDGVRRGHVAVFGAPDPVSGTERVVVMAETRRRDEGARERIRVAINALATDLVAAPPDDIALVAPNTVLRTSSGKVRRAACRARYLAGNLDGAHERAAWQQVARLAAAGIVPQARRLRRAVLERAWAAWAWLVFAGCGLVAAAAGWLPLSRRATWTTVRAVARVAAALCGIHLELAGAAHLPASGGCVVVANHQSYLDGPLLTALLPRPACFVVKADLAGSPLIGRPLRRLGTLFVERFDAAAGVAGLAETGAAVAAGECVVVFAEGTFKRMPGVLPFHLGAFVVAAREGAPVVPLALHGSRSMLRAGSWFPRRGALRARFGAPLAVAPGSDWHAALHLRDGARAHILAQAGEPDLAQTSNVVDDRP